MSCISANCMKIASEAVKYLLSFQGDVTLPFPFLLNLCPVQSCFVSEDASNSLLPFSSCPAAGLYSQLLGGWFEEMANRQLFLSSWDCWSHISASSLTPRDCWKRHCRGKGNSLFQCVPGPGWDEVLCQISLLINYCIQERQQCHS